MTDFVLELQSEEIPARMQRAAAEQLRSRFEALLAGRVPFDALEAYATPRRLVLIARGLAAAGAATREERRGPRADAPAGAIDGFLRSTGLSRDALEERDTPKGCFFYAVIDAPGRPTPTLLAELIPEIVRGFDWPKSMRWGEASRRRDSQRWVRPLTGIVALYGTEVVACEVAGLASGRMSCGHRFMSVGPVEIADAASYAATLRAAHVVLDPAERAAIIADGARAAAAGAGLTLIEDAALVAENAGLTEWPVPLLGHFDPAFLNVPREIIQLTMRTNQKYFALTDGADDAGGALAPAFVCVANIAAADGGAAIVAGNQKVLAARLADARFFWDADVRAGLDSFRPKLAEIVFHEKLGTVADKVERVAGLARWLIESGAVGGDGDRAELADLAEQAARLCKADLTTATVGEFPEVQGIAGRYLALAEGRDPRIADAIRDHYKPVGQGDEVPTAPLSVAVALADKLDTLVGFYCVGETPTGSRDPFALRRAALGLLRILQAQHIRLGLWSAVKQTNEILLRQFAHDINIVLEAAGLSLGDSDDGYSLMFAPSIEPDRYDLTLDGVEHSNVFLPTLTVVWGRMTSAMPNEPWRNELLGFLGDRLKVQQKELGARHDLIEAVFALGQEDDLVRLLARVRALQTFLSTQDGVNLLAGYKRAANILRIEEAKGEAFGEAVDAARLIEPAEIALAAALDIALPAAQTAVVAEDFAAAMTALSQLRPAVDAFFDAVIVNAPDAALRTNRLNLLAQLRAAVHSVADFSKIEG